MAFAAAGALAKMFGPGLVKTLGASIATKGLSKLAKKAKEMMGMRDDEEEERPANHDVNHDTKLRDANRDTKLRVGHPRVVLFLCPPLSKNRLRTTKTSRTMTENPLKKKSPRPRVLPNAMSAVPRLVCPDKT